jgi:hypothetical protein
MSYLPTYCIDDLGYFDFELDGGESWPDWDSTLSVKFYDNDDVLQFTATTISTPALVKGTDTDGNSYVYVTDLELSNYASGIAYVEVTAKIDAEDIIPQPSTLAAFLIDNTCIVPPDPEYPFLLINSTSWVTHSVVDSDNNPVLDLTHDDIICKYWNRYLDNYGDLVLNYNNFVNDGDGNYSIRYTPTELNATGAFLSTLIPSSENNWFFSNRIFTCVSTVEGTCIVSGNCIDMQGEPYNKVTEVILENIYSPTNFADLGGSVTRRSRIFTDITGYFEVRLLRGLSVRVSIGSLGIVKTIEVPNEPTANIFDLLDAAEDELEPV